VLACRHLEIAFTLALLSLIADHLMESPYPARGQPRGGLPRYEMPLHERGGHDHGNYFPGSYAAGYAAGLEQAYTPSYNSGHDSAQNLYMVYDPNTGAFMPYEYAQMHYDGGGYGMQFQGDMQDNRNQQPNMSMGSGRAKRRAAAQVTQRVGGPASGRLQRHPDAAKRSSEKAWDDVGEEAVTTAMLRNIPNKYTMELLVQQLEEHHLGQFDFVYLPMDFKNKCNGGYAFVNFRTAEACKSCFDRFSGMEVKNLLGGASYGGKKVMEVSPARVQGLEENVQRLRNSPVMRELLQKPEWMPIIFDSNGDKMPFPAPERILDPIKPRRSQREPQDEASGTLA